MEDPIVLKGTDFATVARPHTATRRWDVEPIELLPLHSYHPAGLV